MAPTREHTPKSDLGQVDFHDLLRERMLSFITRN